MYFSSHTRAHTRPLRHTRHALPAARCPLSAADSEFRELTEAELAHLKTAALPGDIRVRDMDPPVLATLYRRGLVYWEVPIGPDDRFTIPPLEGFVSNKTTEAGDSAADPLEALLYSVFVASSTRTRVADLAAILNTGACFCCAACRACSDARGRAVRAPHAIQSHACGAERAALIWPVSAAPPLPRPLPAALRCVCADIRDVAAALAVASRLGFATKVIDEPPPQTSPGECHWRPWPCTHQPAPCTRPRHTEEERRGER